MRGMTVVRFGKMMSAMGAERMHTKAKLWYRMDPRTTAGKNAAARRRGLHLRVSQGRKKPAHRPYRIGGTQKIGL